MALRPSCGRYIVRTARPFFLVASLATGVSLAPHDVAADAAQARLRREAIDLFRQGVRPALDASAGRCAVRDAWFDYAIPESIARLHLGLAIHADLVPPDHQTRLREVIDPGGRAPDAVCTDAEAKQRQDELMADFKKARPDSAAGAPASPRLVISHTEYSFPVFGANYRRAVIVVGRTTLIWGASSTGDVKAIGLETGGVAEVYVRRRAGWRLAARELLFSGH
jgi:hypothetical protein